MKKVIISLTMLFCSVSYMLAADPNFPYGDYMLIELSVSYIDPMKPIGERPRNPIQPPIVYLDGHTLYIYGDGRDFDLQVVTEDEAVVYSTYVSSSTTEVQLPTTLSGDYLLQLFNGDFVFIGEIEL